MDAQTASLTPKGIIQLPTDTVTDAQAKWWDPVAQIPDWCDRYPWWPGCALPTSQIRSEESLGQSGGTELFDKVGAWVYPE